MGFLRSFDIMCLTETFIERDFESNVFHDYIPFTAKARKLSHHGRHSGGVIMMIKKKLMQFFRQINVTYENMIVVQAEETLFNRFFSLVFMFHPLTHPLTDQRKTEWELSH